DPRGFAKSLCALGEEFEFGFALDVEEENARSCCIAESGVHLPGLLAHAGEDDARESLRCCAAYALQLAAGDDVEAATERCEELEDGKRGVRLHRVADGVVDAGELACEH